MGGGAALVVALEVIKTGGRKVAKVLVADSDPRDLNWLKMHIAYEGHEVLTAENGDQATVLAVQHVPDLIWLDLDLAVKDGLQVCADIRSLSRTQHIPVIMTAASKSSWQQDAARRSGASDFLMKPLDHQKVVECLKLFLSPRP